MHEDCFAESVAQSRLMQKKTMFLAQGLSLLSFGVNAALSIRSNILAVETFEPYSLG